MEYITLTKVQNRTSSSGCSWRFSKAEQRGHSATRFSQFISCQLMVICRLTRPIQNLPTPDSSGLGRESKRRCSRSTPVPLTTPSAPLAAVSSTQAFGLAARKAHSPSRFLFRAPSPTLGDTCERAHVYRQTVVLFLITKFSSLR